MEANLKYLALLMLIIMGVILAPTLAISVQSFRIAYTVYTTSERSDIFIMDDDGGNPHQLTDGRGINAFPSWSPDGKTIAFDTNRHGSFDLYIVNTNGSGLHRLTKTSTFDERHPSWSPNGNQIIYDIWSWFYIMDNVMDANRREEVSVQMCISGEYASWSPDGNALAFKSCSAMNEIYTMELNGDDCGRLTDEWAYDSRPSWSPDGESILFSSAIPPVESNFEIYRYHTASKNLEKLTDSPGWDVDPCWSPDGKRIAFASSRAGQFDIYAMDASGENVTKLTNSLLDERHPVWSPPLPTAVNIEGKAIIYWGKLKSE